MKPNASQFVEAVASRLSPDGQTTELGFLLKDGSITSVQFPAPAAASIMLNIEQALGTLFEQQRAMLKGRDPRTFFTLGAKQVVKVQGAVAQGHPVVSFVLKSNVRLDFLLEPSAVPELIEWLRGLETRSHKPPDAHN